MKGLDENKFDDILRSKLEGSSVEPTRDLLPNIMEAIDASNTTGGSRTWVGGLIIGLLAISVLGYYVYSSMDSDQPKSLADTSELVEKVEKDAKELKISDKQISSSIDKSNNNSIQRDNTSELIRGKESGDFVESAESNNIDNNTAVAKNASTANENISESREAVDQKKSSSEVNRAVVTEKSVVAKVLAKKSAIIPADNMSEDTNASEGTTVVDDLIDSSVSNREPVAKVVSNQSDSNINESTSESHTVDSNSNVESASSDGASPEGLRSKDLQVDGANESNSSVTLETKDNINSTVVIGDESKDLLGVNSAGEQRLEEFSESVSLSNGSDDFDNVDQNESESNNTLIDNPIAKVQIEQNTSGQNNLDQTSSEFVDSIQTAMQAQVIQDSTAMEGVTTLELKERKWSVDFMAGPSMSYRIFNAEGNQELQDHKNSNETSLMTSAYSLEISRTLSKKWKLHIGAMYLKTGEKYAFSNGITSHETTNQYDYLSIPLGVDFYLFEAGKFEFLTGVGVQYNFLQKGGSSWLDPHDFNAQIYAHDDVIKAFKDQVLAWNAEFGIRYRLRDRIDVIVKEQGILFNNIYESKMGMNQKEYSFETLIGLGIRF